MKKIIFVLCLMSFAITARATSGVVNNDPRSPDLIDFMNKVFPSSNLGAALPGGGQVVLDSTKMFASLKKVLRKSVDVICKSSSDRTGWYEYGSKSIQGYENDTISVHLYHYIDCDEGDLYPTVAIVQSARAKKWVVMQNFMQTVDFAKVYGFHQTYEEQIIVTGSDLYPGGDVEAPRVLKIKLNENREIESTSELLSIY